MNTFCGKESIKKHWWKKCSQVFGGIADKNTADSELLWHWAAYFRDPEFRKYVLTLFLGAFFYQKSSLVDLIVITRIFILMFLGI